MAPLISVIMPVYNGERFIRPAIESMLAQTCQDWELIIIDDGSIDGTPAILNGFDDPRIVKLRQSNGGEGLARNQGLDRARGVYIGLLDADDLYLPNALADMSAFLDQRPEYDVAFADGYFCDEQTQPTLRLSEIRPAVYTGFILEQLVLDSAVLTVPVCTMTRRATIEARQVRFDTSLVIGPDWDFWIQLARTAQFGYLDKLTCMYRVHEANITRRSGRAKRTEDLVRGRLKVMHSDWFGDLSLPTRRAFFYHLLIGLAGRRPAIQQPVLDSAAFADLPAPERAGLLRQVAIDYLQHDSANSFGSECLHRAAMINPGDAKTRYLLSTMRLGALATKLALRSWHAMHMIGKQVRSLGKRKPKPVPAALRPVTE